MFQGGPAERLDAEQILLRFNSVPAASNSRSAEIFSFQVICADIFKKDPPFFGQNKEKVFNASQTPTDADFTEMQGDKCLNLKEEKEQQEKVKEEKMKEEKEEEEKKEKEKAVQVEQSPGWFQKVKSPTKAKDEDKARVDIMSGWM